MVRTSRRNFLLGLSGVVSGGWFARRSVEAVSAQAIDSTWTLEKLGHSILGAPPVEFAEGSVRNDGQYAAIGTWNGDDYGSFLVDISDPANPRKNHFLPSPDRVMNLDVKFDNRDGLYYRIQQPIEDQAIAGIEVIDYGYEEGTPTNPVVVGRADAGSTHNLYPHHGEPLVYAVNHDQDSETDGLEVWDVSNPTSPEFHAEVGRSWSLHDVTTDPDRDLLHCAYGKGYVAMDASDPYKPTEIGLLDYRERPTYAEVGLGNEGFETGHYALADPRRDLVIMGDEVSTGVPGGKHILDIGWGEGSPENPVSIGFTTSPNATVQEPDEDQTRGDIVFNWTGHNFDVVPWGDATLLVSGDWHEGTVLYDITDPRNPQPIDRYPTDEGADMKPGQSRWGPPPFAWSAVYNPEQDIIVVSDVITGIYTLEISGLKDGTTGDDRATAVPDTEFSGSNRGSQEGKDDPSWFDFNGDGMVSFDDVQALWRAIVDH